MHIRKGGYERRLLYFYYDNLIAFPNFSNILNIICGPIDLKYCKLCYWYIVNDVVRLLPPIIIILTARELLQIDLSSSPYLALSILLQTRIVIQLMHVLYICTFVQIFYPFKLREKKSFKTLYLYILYLWKQILKSYKFEV